MTAKKKTRIVVAGAGFGGVYTSKHLHTLFRTDPTVEITLVNDTNYFLFTPLLHEVATGGIDPGNIVEPLRKVLRRRLTNLYVTHVTGVSRKQHILHTTHGDIPYEYLVLALGSQTAFFNTPGAQTNTYTLKSLDDARRLKNRFIACIEEATTIEDKKKRTELLRFVIVGGGPTGVELAAEISELFSHTFAKYYPQKHLIDEVEIILIQRGPTLLPRFNASIQKKSLDVLRKKGVTIKINTTVNKIDTHRVHLKTGETINAGTVIWVAGVEPRSIAFDTSVEKTAHGALIVDEYLNLPNDKHIFVLGDMTYAVNSANNIPLPALAQVAEKQAAFVANNIHATIKATSMKPMRYHSSGSLISLGQWMAAGEVGGFHFSGRLAWWIWRTVYLSKLISWQKKIQVALDWTITLFSPRDISQF